MDQDYPEARPRPADWTGSAGGAGHGAAALQGITVAPMSAGALDPNVAAMTAAVPGAIPVQVINLMGPGAQQQGAAGLPHGAQVQHVLASTAVGTTSRVDHELEMTGRIGSYGPGYFNAAFEPHGREYDSTSYYPGGQRAKWVAVRHTARASHQYLTMVQDEVVCKQGLACSCRACNMPWTQWVAHAAVPWVLYHSSEEQRHLLPCLCGFLMSGQVAIVCNDMPCT